MPCDVEVARQRSRDLDVPVRDGIVSREAVAGVTMKPSSRSVCGGTALHDDLSHSGPRHADSDGSGLGTRLFKD